MSQIVSIDPEKRKDASAKAEILRQVDLTILCLPDAAAKESVAVVDSLGAGRSRACSTPRPPIASRPAGPMVFRSLPPVRSKEIAAARRVSNPGCYATGAIAMLRPLVDAGLVDPGQSAGDQCGFRFFRRRQADDRGL